MAKQLSTKIEISATDHASAVVKNIGKEFGAFGKQVDKVRDNINGALLGIGTSALGAVAGGGLGLGGVLSQAAAYETAVVNMAKVTDRSFSQVKADVAALSPELGSQTQLMQGYYAVMSAGVTDSTQALDLLTVASQGSKAAQVTQAQTITALTKIMAGYAGEIKTAAEASDLLFSIEKQGQTTFAELVPVIGDVAAISRQANVSSDEMGAMFSAITQTAGGTAQAATQYRAVLMSLIKPQEQMRNLLKDMGYSSGEALIKQKGLAGALMAVNGAAQKSGVELGRLFESSEALTALGPLLATNFARVTANMVAMENKAGATSRAWENYKNTLAGLWDTTRNSFENLTVDTGGMLAPGAAEGLRALNSGLSLVRDNLDSIATVGKVVAVSYATMAAGQKITTSETLRSHIAVIRDSVQASAQKAMAVQAEAAASLKNVQASMADAEAQLLAARARIQNAVSSRQVVQASAAETAALLQLMATQTAVITAEQRLAMATTQTAAAQARVSLSSRALSGIRAGASGLINFMGGPWVAGFTAAAAGVTLLYSAIQDREALLDKYSNGLQDIGTVADSTAQKIDAATSSIARSNVNTAQNNLKTIQNDYKAIFKEVQKYAENPSTSMLGLGNAFSEAASKGIQELAVLKRFLEKEISPYEAQQQIMEIGVAGSQASRLVESLATAFRKESEAAAQLNEQKQTLNDIENAASGAATGFNELAAALDLLSGRSAAPANSLEGAIKRLREVTKETEAAKKETIALSKEQARKDLRTLEWGIYGARQSGDPNAALKLQAEYDKQNKRVSEIGAKSNTGGSDKKESALRALQGINAEIEKLKGSGESFDFQLAKKLAEIAKEGKNAGLSLTEIIAKQNEFSAVAKADNQRKYTDALRDMDIELAKLAGDMETVRSLESHKTIEEYTRKFATLVPITEDLTQKIQSLADAQGKQSRIKDASAAAQFYKELAQLSGDFGASTEYNNELLRLQAENFKQNAGVSQELVDQWVKLKSLQESTTWDAGIMRATQNYVTQSQDAAKQTEDIFTSTYQAIGNVGGAAMTEIFDKGNFAVDRFFINLTKNLAIQAQNAITNKLFGAILGLIGKGIGGLFGLNSSTSSSTGIGSPDWINPGMRHAGGQGSGPPYYDLPLPTSMFANAPRLHTGGGKLAPDEYPAVLLNSERVLNPDETRAYNAAMALKPPSNHTITIEKIMQRQNRLMQPQAQQAPQITINPVVIDRTKSGVAVEVQQKTDNNGNLNIELLIGDSAAKQMTTPGTTLNRAVGAQTGARRPAIRR